MWVCRLPVHIDPAGCTAFTEILGEFVTSHWADRVVGPYNNTALSVGADDSVRPRDVPILRESSANSQLPPTSKEVTACGFAANSRRNSLHSAGRSRAPPLPTAVAFQRFLRKTNRLWS